jgi:hypothetical protein
MIFDSARAAEGSLGSLGRRFFAMMRLPVAPYHDSVGCRLARYAQPVKAKAAVDAVERACPRIGPKSTRYVPKNKLPNAKPASRVDRPNRTNPLDRESCIPCPGPGWRDSHAPALVHACGRGGRETASSTIHADSPGPSPSGKPATSAMLWLRW